MVLSIVKQAIDLRLHFENPPRITASTEICVICGMLCALCGRSLPDADTTGDLQKEVLASLTPSDDRTEKLYRLLADCQRDSEPMTDEWRELIGYGYAHAAES